MKKLALILALSLPSPAVMADTPAEVVLAIRNDCRVSASYSFTVIRGETRFLFSGEAVVQGECFFIDGNGVQVYCDGSRTVLVSPSDKEITIEAARPISQYIDDNAGSISEVAIRNVRKSPLSDDLSLFRFDTSKAGADWIITDTR